LSDKPFVPAGRAWTGDGGTANPLAIIEFAKAAFTQCEAIGISWWFLDHVVRPEYADVAIALKSVNEGKYELPPIDYSQVTVASTMTIRIFPEVSTSSRRTQLLIGDKLKLSGNTLVSGDYEWAPVIVYVARRNLKTGQIYCTFERKKS
jgi:hypothetical protein